MSKGFDQDVSFNFIEKSAEHLGLEVPEHFYMPGIGMIDVDDYQDYEEARLLRSQVHAKQNRSARVLRS